MDFLKQQFDKILLASLFIAIFTTSVFLQIKPGMDEGIMDWARHNGDLVLGALLMLITRGLVKIGAAPIETKEPVPPEPKT